MDTHLTAEYPGGDHDPNAFWGGQSSAIASIPWCASTFRVGSFNPYSMARTLLEGLCALSLACGKQGLHCPVQEVRPGQALQSFFLWGYVVQHVLKNCPSFPLETTLFIRYIFNRKLISSHFLGEASSERLSHQ